MSRNPIKCTMLFPSGLRKEEDIDPHSESPHCNRMYRRFNKDHCAFVSLPFSVLLPEPRGVRRRQREPQFDHAVNFHSLFVLDYFSR